MKFGDLDIFKIDNVKTKRKLSLKKPLTLIPIQDFLVEWSSVLL